MPLIHRQARARNQLATANRECRLEDRVIRLLLHEQRDVLESIVVVHAETAANDVIAVAVQVISEAYAWAEALAVVSCLLFDQGGSKRAKRSGRLQFLERPALRDV